MSTPVTAEREGLSRTATGRAVPSAWVRARSRVRLEDPLIGWSASIGVFLLALFLRLWNLGTPHRFEFDETYYAKDAWSLAHFGYVREYVADANTQILDGHTTGLWTDNPSLIVHPEVGKWLIAIGERLFGMNPFGWRIAAAVVGSLMILVMVRLARRLTGSTALGVVAGLLMTFDGLQFVLSRLALLDIFVAFFLLCSVHCVVLDRDWYRAKMARLTPAPIGEGGWGPVRALLFRPWLALAGVCFGLTCGSKWEGVYPLAAFGVVVWLWSAGARRSFGVRLATLKSAAADGIPAFLHLVVIGLVVYVASWTGWLVHADTYEQHLSSTQYTQFVGGNPTCGEGAQLDKSRVWPSASGPDASGLADLVQSLRSLWYFHQDVYTFHTHFLNGCTHTYASKPSGWLLLNRPVGVDADVGIQPGTRGCDAPPGSDCLRQVLLLGTPALWWGGCLAMVYALVMWVGARDWRFGLCVVGLASTWLPWLFYDSRPIFSFYSIISLPFIVLALTLAMGRLIGTPGDPGSRRTLGVIVAGSFFVLVLLNFAWFWPIYTDGLLTHQEWTSRIWFSRWV